MQNLNESYFKKCYNREKNRILTRINEIKEVIRKNKNAENNKILDEILSDLLIHMFFYFFLIF